MTMRSSNDLAGVIVYNFTEHRRRRISSSLGSGKASLSEWKWLGKVGNPLSQVCFCELYWLLVGHFRVQCNLGAFLESLGWLSISYAGLEFALAKANMGVLWVKGGVSGRWQTSGTDAAESCQQPELKGPSVGPPMPISSVNSFS